MSRDHGALQNNGGEPDFTKLALKAWSLATGSVDREESELSITQPRTLMSPWLRWCANGSSRCGFLDHSAQGTVNETSPPWGCTLCQAASPAGTLHGNNVLSGTATGHSPDHLRDQPRIPTTTVSGFISRIPPGESGSIRFRSIYFRQRLVPRFYHVHRAKHSLGEGSGCSRSFSSGWIGAKQLQQKLNSSLCLAFPPLATVVPLGPPDGDSVLRLFEVVYAAFRAYLAMVIYERTGALPEYPEVASPLNSYTAAEEEGLWKLLFRIGILQDRLGFMNWQRTCLLKKGRADTAAILRLPIDMAGGSKYRNGDKIILGGFGRCRENHDISTTCNYVFQNAPASKTPKCRDQL
ncbi:hypothetical protein B0H14DRAFT_2571291 [Mycena olivaceomarginata]|nr:hypothetical protein B0H14DRAFT_2571291 [Mycena olivaceomarginata]